MRRGRRAQLKTSTEPRSGRAQDRLGDRRRIAEVVLLSLRVGTHAGISRASWPNSLSRLEDCRAIVVYGTRQDSRHHASGFVPESHVDLASGAKARLAKGLEQPAS